ISSSTIIYSFLNTTPTTVNSTLALHDALPIFDADAAVNLYLSAAWRLWQEIPAVVRTRDRDAVSAAAQAVLRVVNDAVRALVDRSEEHTSELQSRENLVCSLLLESKNFCFPAL